MEEDAGKSIPFKYPASDFLLTVGGMMLFLLDVALDVWAVVTFYQEEAYVFMGLLVFLLLGSSALVQVFSWLWYHYDKGSTETKTESLVKNLHLLKILHVFQMGVYLRYAGLVRISICGFCSKKRCMEDIAVYLTHDLSLLRLIETFSESAPQLVLMITIIIQRGMVEPITILKALGSVSAIAVSVTMYHRSLRSFLPDKAKQGWISSVVYFMWNLLLIGPRVAAVALFASVFPCFIAVHFLSSWMVLFFVAWQLKTDFMDSAGGEWLYRATVGLIWYFSWFSIVEGHTRQRSTIYHTWIGVDIGMLCGFWVWQMMKNPPYFELPLDPYVIFVIMILLYIAGLCLKVIYYKFCHPKITKLGEVDLRLELVGVSQNGKDEVDFRFMGQTERPEPSVRFNKRMRNLADNFYS
ncbi:XK-related protein 8 [Salmo salar]|uniref:XK-related protein n=1 Tax=Salmo salar TaxID=8030 RepID=A0A1S3Q2M2_SALSA|nr:XK-related protein 8 [Salmo salar]|eukprot:XP_014034151.1 PREDICTED: XK-related protein 8-like [Salmo salar]